MKHFAMIALAAFGALLATAPGAPAQSPPDVNCPPYAGVPSTVHNVTVPDNKACQLVGVTVTGNVTVGRGLLLKSSEAEGQFLATFRVTTALLCCSTNRW